MLHVLLNPQSHDIVTSFQVFRSCHQFYPSAYWGWESAVATVCLNASLPLESDGSTMIRGPNTELCLGPSDAARRGTHEWTITAHFTLTRRHLNTSASQRHTAIFASLEAATFMNHFHSTGLIACWLPHSTPLLSRDLQLESQQLQRELWAGSSSSSHLEKQSAQKYHVQFVVQQCSSC